jgi:hypothetical protein
MGVDAGKVPRGAALVSDVPRPLVDVDTQDCAAAFIGPITIPAQKISTALLIRFIVNLPPENIGWRIGCLRWPDKRKLCGLSATASIRTFVYRCASLTGSG